MPFFSTVYIKTYAFLNLLFTRILAKTCILMQFCLNVFIHAQKSGEELNLVFAQSCLCATVPPTIPSVFHARLVPSGSPFIESWYVRLNENARVGGNA